LKSYSDLYGLIKRAVSEEIHGEAGVRITPGPATSMADQEFLESIADSSQPAIISGLEVIASTPPSMSVTIKSGFGYIEGRRVEVAEDTLITVPTGKAVWYVLVNAGVRISKYPLNAGLIAAKIILQAESLRIVQEKVLIEGPDGYLIDGRSVYSAMKYDPSDPAFRYAIAEALPDIFAENIFGELTLSEKLRLVNARGTMEARSDGMRFFDTSGRILAEYLSTRARVAGWNIEPGRLYSQNILIDSANESIGTADFVSGALGKGWRITPDEAEFQNARIRGTLSTAVFKKDTISALNATFLIANSTMLAEDLTSVATDIIVKESVFSNGDRVRIKDGFADEWMVVTSTASSSGDNWSYAVTRSSPVAWTAGVAVVSLGNWNGSVGTGFIMLDAASQYAPFIDAYIRTGPNQLDYSLKARLGRLDGISDSHFGNLSGYGLYSENAYLKGKLVVGPGSTGLGLFDDAGDLALLDSVDYDDITGSKPPINADNTTTTIDGGIITTGFLNLSTNGNIRSGQTGYNTGIGFWIGDAAGTPRFSLGNPGGNYLTWDGSILTLSGAVNITGGNAVKQNDSITLLTGRTANNISESATRKWASQTGATKNNVFYQSSTPTAETTGDLWFNTSTYTFSKWSGSTWDAISDVTAQKTAAAIAGQGTLATLNSADYGSNVSGTKPPSDATRNIIYRQTSQPSGVTGDLWYDTDDTLQTFYYYNGSSWVVVGNYANNTSQLTDGANLGGTATWGGVSDKPTFGNMAYENLVELAKLGNTVVSGGYLQTILIDAAYIQAGTITGRTLQTKSDPGSGDRSRFIVSASDNYAHFYDSNNYEVTRIGLSPDGNTTIYGKFGGSVLSNIIGVVGVSNLAGIVGVGQSTPSNQGGVGGIFRGGASTGYSNADIIWGNVNVSVPAIEGTSLLTKFSSSLNTLYAWRPVSGERHLETAQSNGWLFSIPFVKIVTWTGNGSSQSIPVGFSPDMIIGARSSTTSGRYWWSWISGMATDRVRFFHDGSMPTGVINSVDSMGFTVGSNVNANESGVAFSAICIKARIN